MKKIILGLIAVLVLTGCSFQLGTKETTYVIEDGNLETKIILEHTSTKVLKETVINTITFDSSSDMELVKEYIEEYEDLYEDVDGLKHTVKYEKKKIIETIEIDFKKFDFDETDVLDQLGLDEDLKDGVGFKETEELLLDEGYEKVE